MKRGNGSENPASTSQFLMSLRREWVAGDSQERSCGWAVFLRSCRLVWYPTRMLVSGGFSAQRIPAP